ncbi:putative DNA repair protein MutK [Conyzicola nivalis]|uniref:DNA repair protein MutK n=1 Tax=Conyzicola nivalis TaxID=1477021 RepID=A0ABV2QMS1_9MICO
MSVGLLAVVDDILTVAIKASAKTAGVVIDDAAVTPQYVQGLSPARELRVVLQIALGSLFNKFIIIIPLALLLSAFAPWVLPWLLIIGGTYLCFEGAEKVTEWFGAHHGPAETEARDERKLVFGAIRTDLILSTEIMLISLASIDPDFGIWMTLGALAVIGLGMTILVYGVVAALVKIDDVGLALMKHSVRKVRRTGARIVRAMPAVFRVISIVGTVAMLWVGGHLVIANLAETFWHGPYDLLHAVTHAIEGAGPVIVWVTDTAISAVVGLALGLVIIGIIMAISRVVKKKEPESVSH